MRVVVAPDSYKGSVSAVGVAAAENKEKDAPAATRS